MAPQVLLVGLEQQGELRLLLEAELRLSGFVASSFEQDIQDKQDLADAMRSRGAQAAVWLKQEPQGVGALWVLNPATNRFDRASQTRALAPRDLALRATELLRSSYSELLAAARAEQPREAGTASSSPSPSPSVPEPPERHPVFAGTLGPSLLLSPGSEGVDLVVQLQAELYAADRFSIGARGRLPTVRRELSDTEGTVRLRPWWIGGVGWWHWGALGAVSLRSGVGAGAFLLHAEAEAGAGYNAATQLATAAVAEVTNDVSVEWGPVLLSLDAAVGWALQQVRVRFGSRDVARWGRPMVSVALCVGARAY